MLGLWKLFTRQKRWGVVMFYTGCGLGVLAKGPLGLALPVISLVGILAWTRRWRLLLEMRPLPGALLVLSIIGAWAIPASVLSGGEYFYELVWVRTIRPIFFPLQGHGGQNLLGYLALLPAYIPILFLALTPWCLLLVPAIRRIGCEGWRSDRAGFLGGWVVAQLAILSLVRTKLPHYILPLLPALAIVTGVFLADALQRPAELGKMWSHIRQKVLLAGAFVLSVIVFISPIMIGFPREWPWFIPAALIAPIAGCWVVAHLKYRRYCLAHMTLVAGVLLFFAFLWQIGLPSLEKGKPSWQVASFLKEHYGEKRLSSVRVARSSFHQPSLLFYLGESVERLSDTEDIDHFLQVNEPAVVILPENKLHQAISEGLAAPYEVLWRKSVWIPGKIKWQPLVIIKNKRGQ
jgi:4-amino-4-deoxy-L-arabinose transferase-like glycosyltransferase